MWVEADQEWSGFNEKIEVLRDKNSKYYEITRQKHVLIWGYQGIFFAQTRLVLCCFSEHIREMFSPEPSRCPNPRKHSGDPSGLINEWQLPAS